MTTPPHKFLSRLGPASRSLRRASLRCAGLFPVPGSLFPSSDFDVSTIRRFPISNRSRGFSLLETTIALSILGVGLIMVAAVFPVAISEHRQSTEKARAFEVFSKAEAMISAKVNTTDLWVHPDYLPGGLLVGQDSPWYLLPTPNLARDNDCWDAMLQGSGAGENYYANLINGDVRGDAFLGNGNSLDLLGVEYLNFNRLPLFGLDFLSDDAAPFTNFRNGTPCMSAGVGILAPSASPFTDAELMAVPNRLVWYGFYRRLAAGNIQFAAAVCKQRRRQFYPEQDVTRASFSSDLAYFRTDRRIPVPWRVLVAWDGGNIISNGPVVTPIPPGGVKLSELAPIGSKLFVRGGVDVIPPVAPGTIVPTIRAGTVLTVSDIIDDYSVEVVGDTSGLVPSNFAFDIWVFPPAYESGFLGRLSPVIDWRVPL